MFRLCLDSVETIFRLCLDYYKTIIRLLEQIFKLNVVYECYVELKYLWCSCLFCYFHEWLLWAGYSLALQTCFRSLHSYVSFIFSFLFKTLIFINKFAKQDYTQPTNTAHRSNNTNKNIIGVLASHNIHKPHLAWISALIV